MGTTGRPPLSTTPPTKPPRPVRPALPAPIASLASSLRLGDGLRLGERLRAVRRPDPGSPLPPGRGMRSPAEPPADPLLAAGRQLREAREAAGLGLRQLAQETRISTPVLEALERGWRERLPEAAYLRTMLPLLQRRLGLEPGCLDAALPPERLRFHGPRREPLLRRFTPGSIDVFTTWQGTLLYGLLTLLLIFGLNLQQRRLALQGLLSPLPLPPMAPAAEKAASSEERNATLLQAFPELQPLRRAADGQALRQLRQERRRPQPAPAAGARP
jgi:hypothetical protein